MNEKLKSTLQKIKLLAEQNHEFDQALRKMYEATSSAKSASMPNTVANDIQVIREVLEIRANPSITYEFVKTQRLRDLLTVDNLRMENAALDLEDNEQERLQKFCVSAFYQIESILNYYFHLATHDINDLLDVIEEATNKEVEAFQFKRKGSENNVTHIEVASKINAFCRLHFPTETALKSRLGVLRKVRNDAVHRTENQIDNLCKFAQRNNFNSVRADLVKVVSAIEKNINITINPIQTIEGKIVTMLPSVCFVTYNGKNEQLPNALFSKVKDLKVGDLVQLKIGKKGIVDVVFIKPLLVL